MTAGNTSNSAKAQSRMPPPAMIPSSAMPVKLGEAGREERHRRRDRAGQ